MRKPLCSGPRRLPAPRISRSRMAILKPEPNSTKSRMAPRRLAATSLDDEVKKVMLEEFFSYDKIVNISRDSENRVNSVSSDATLINRFTNDLGISVGDELDKRSQITHKIPITNLIGLDLFAGMGPSIPIRFYPISVTNADITHTFEEAGINQTLHTINLTVSVDMAIVVPMAHSSIRAESTMPIAQTLIVGTVPEAYLNRK